MKNLFTILGLIGGILASIAHANNAQQQCVGGVCQGSNNVVSAVYSTPQPIQSAYTQTAYTQPAYSQTSYPQASYAQTSYPQTSYPQQVYSQQSYPQQSYSQPVYSQSTYSSGYAQPAYGQPVYSQAAYAQPAYSQPAYSQPVYSQPVTQTYSQASYSQPVYSNATYANSNGYIEGQVVSGTYTSQPVESVQQIQAVQPIQTTQPVYYESPQAQVQTYQAQPYQATANYAAPQSTYASYSPSTTSMSGSGLAQQKAVQAAQMNLRGHLGGGLGGFKYEGVGWSNVSPQHAIEKCCYWGVRPTGQIGVSRGSDGCWYACVLYN